MLITINIFDRRSILWLMFLNLLIEKRWIHNELARMDPTAQRVQPNLY